MAKFFGKKPVRGPPPSLRDTPRTPRPRPAGGGLEQPAGFEVDPLAPRWLGPGGAGGRYKVQLTDFIVSELPHGCPKGQGYSWYRVRRTGWDTPEVARVLARAADVESEDVGWAGLKDRDAVAEQRFTILGGRRLRELPPGLELVDSGTTREPLRPGALDGNRFTIVVRGGDLGIAAARLAKLARFPNRFGPQRTGNGLPELGRDVLLGQAAALDPQRRRFALIAWQAACFNLVLESRGPRAIPGDLFEGGAATGPIFGARMRWPRGACLALEEGVLRESGITLDHLDRVSKIIPGDRRLLTVPAIDARITPHPEGFVLEVTLGAGCYATSLLQELL